MEVEISSSDLDTLDKFASSEYGNIQDAHTVLSHMIKHVELSQGYTPPTWNELIAETLGGNTNVMLIVSTVFPFIIMA